MTSAASPFPSKPATAPVNGTVTASFAAHGKHRLTFPPAGEMARYEQFPPTLFVKAVSGDLTAVSDTDPAGQRNIGVTGELSIAPSETRTLIFVAGYTRDIASIDALSASLEPPASAKPLGSAFGDVWMSILPNFSSESDAILRREMVWNAAALESMATWREYYDETVIPQGTIYDYLWGNMASSRDLAQQALPFCHTNPAIARSTLRFIMKRMLPDGTVQLNDEGFGWCPSGGQQTSDQQLYFFLLLAEYLRATHDERILTEPIGYYPLDNSGHDTGLAHVRQAFLFLRDRVGTASHGIICRWNSDWNDMFGWWPSDIPLQHRVHCGRKPHELRHGPRHPRRRRQRYRRARATRSCRAHRRHARIPLRVARCLEPRPRQPRLSAPRVDGCNHPSGRRQHVA